MTKLITQHTIRQSLRNYMRLKRHTISSKMRKLSSQKIKMRILTDPRIYTNKNIALFFSYDGEINTYPLIKVLLAMGKNVYLPVLHPFISKNLIFLPYTTNTSMIINRLHFYEPKFNISKQIDLFDLDILFIPLVAFDNLGSRLGMGGGFYDRILQHWELRKNFSPIGLGYSWQKLSHLIPITKWDITLPEIITPDFHWKNN